MRVAPFTFTFQGNGATPCQYWYHSKANWFRYNFAADSFYTMKFCSRLLEFSSFIVETCVKDDKFRYLIPILRMLGAALKLGWWLVGKPVYDFLFAIIELFSLAFTVEALKGKTCQDLLLSRGGRSVLAKISGGRGRPWKIFFGLYKTRHIMLSDSANCTVLCVVGLTQYRRVTDRQTDGRNCRS